MLQALAWTAENKAATWLGPERIAHLGREASRGAAHAPWPGASWRLAWADFGRAAGSRPKLARPTRRRAPLRALPPGESESKTVESRSHLSLEFGLGK